jgi:DNA primase
MIKNVDEIRNAAPILEVVRQHVDLQRKGSNYIGLCPFHDEKNALLYRYSPQKIYSSVLDVEKVVMRFTS